MNAFRGPHQGQPVFAAGEPVSQAGAAMLMVHGRGATAKDILSLAGEFAQPGFAYLAPQAVDNSWYPNRFLAPLPSNEPWLSSALSFVADILARILSAGISPDRVILLGFSQGACLTLEFAARNARRYGGVVGLSGALIGPAGATRDHSGRLNGTPVFLGCSETDFHVPKERVQHSTGVFQRLGAQVTERLYPDMGHTINADEIDFVRGMMGSLIAGSAG